MARRCLQLLVVLYVTLYQLWYAQGYQEFSSVESSTTTKVITARKDSYNLKPWPLWLWCSSRLCKTLNKCISVPLLSLVLLYLDNNWENQARGG